MPRAPLREQGHRPGRCRCLESRAGMEQELCHRTQQHAAEDRRPHRGKPGQDRPCGNLGQRQSHPRNPGRRHSPDRRPLPLLRRRDPRRVRRGLRPGCEYGVYGSPRTPGRGGSDHPLELPHPHGRLETGTGPGRRQLRGAQACRTNPGFHSGGH